MYVISPQPFDVVLLILLSSLRNAPFAYVNARCSAARVCFVWRGGFLPVGGRCPYVTLGALLRRPVRQTRTDRHAAAIALTAEPTAFAKINTDVATAPRVVVAPHAHACTQRDLAAHVFAGGKEHIHISAKSTLVL